MRASRYSKRTNLFLVRLWTHDAPDGSGNTECTGKVQRVIDGESHQFDDWRGLMDLLLTMASGDSTTDSTPLDNVAKPTADLE